jgi:serine/threonine protein kinase
MEYIELCTLNTLIENNKGKIREKTIKVIAKNLLRAIRVLHKQKICHRDIWPKNILCSKDGTKLKIIDFGVSRRFSSKKD